MRFHFHSSRGQALLETVLILPLFLILVGGILVFSYSWLGRWWMDHWAYRANICMIEGTSPWQCQKQMEQKINLVVVKSHYRVEKFWITRRESQVQVKFCWRFPPQILHWTLEIPIRSHISLPLSSRL